MNSVDRKMEETHLAACMYKMIAMSRSTWSHTRLLPLQRRVCPAGMLLPTAVVAPAGYNGMYVFDCGKRDDFLADGSRCKDGTKDPYASLLTFNHYE